MTAAEPKRRSRAKGKSDVSATGTRKRKDDLKSNIQGYCLNPIRGAGGKKIRFSGGPVRT
jgi:hypothetical protein